MTGYVVPVAADGSISLPPELAARWWGTTVVMTDLGGRIVLRRVPASSAAAVRGKYRSRGPSTLEARRRGRDADV